MTRKEGMGIGFVWYAEERGGKDTARKMERQRGIPEIEQQIGKEVFYSLTR